MMNKRLESVFKRTKINLKSCERSSLNDHFFTEQTIFYDGLLLNEQFKKKLFKKLVVFLKQRSIWLNEQFYWIIVHWENYRNKCKMNDNFANKQNNFWKIGKKITKWVIHNQWMDKLKNAEQAHLLLYSKSHI